MQDTANTPSTAVQVLVYAKVAGRNHCRLYPTRNVMMQVYATACYEEFAARTACQ
jgi:hypothetical protein